MTYSPEGKVFQIEYAHKAVDNSGYVQYYRRIFSNEFDPSASKIQISLIDEKIFINGKIALKLIKRLIHYAHMVQCFLNIFGTLWYLF